AQGTDVVSAGRGSGVAHYADLRVLRLQCLRELQEVLEELLTQGFFVTDLDVGQAEGLGVPHLCSYRTPFRVGGPVGEFHQVQGVLDVPVQVLFVYGGIVLRATGHQCGNDGDRGGSQRSEEHTSE